MRLHMDTVLPVKEGTHKFTELEKKMPDLRFNAESWPPTPEGWRDIKRIQAQPLPNSITSELEVRIREAALRDEGVRKALGDRFAFIASDALPSGKGKQELGGEALSSRLVFFSHSRNTAVEVALKGTVVQHVEEKKGHQPKEGQEEIVEAIRIARTEETLRGEVELLDAHAILQPSHDEQVGCGHRTMWITFTESGAGNHEKPALFAATVDMITGTVSMAGRVAPASPKRGGTNHAE